MKIIWRFCLLLLLIGCQADFIFALENPRVIINEVCWMGTKNSANDEWLELFNQTNKPLSLEGWLLKADDGVPKINLSGIIPAHGFYVLERTDDNTLVNVSADKIYKGALENTGENLKLYDNFGKLIDEIICQDKWLAGNNQTKQTMERTKDNSWQNSQEAGGTPKFENSPPLKNNFKENLPEAGSGSLSGSLTPLSKSQSPTTTPQNLSLITAIIIAFSFSLIILFLKKELKKN